ncbi:MAG: glycosyltransferase family 2 protein, partial [Pseudomonadota bacterium]
MADIAVIIVNYGTADLALAAARSVLAQEAGGHRIEVHLVDNASPGGDAAAIADQIAAEGLTGRLRFHPEATNHGFGRGNNVVLEALAARATPPDYAFLLNPDAALENGAAAVLAEFLDAHPEAGAAGAEIRNPGEVRPAAGAYRFPSLGSIFSEAVNFGPVQRLFQKTKVAMPLPDRAARVDWVSGAAVMFRMAALRQTGFFDPAYFLYFEEVDLMLRLTRAGWQV